MSMNNNSRPMGGLHGSIAEARQMLAGDTRHKAMDEHKRNELNKLSPKDARPLGRTGGLRPLGGGAGGGLDPMGLPVKPSNGLPAVRNFGGDASNAQSGNIWTGGKVGDLLGSSKPTRPAKLGKLGAVAPLGAVAVEEDDSHLSKKEKKKRKKLKKKQKKSAKAIQRFYRKKMEKHVAARVIQTKVRQYLAKGWVKMLRQAQQAGVMVAIQGTTQGKSGWYQDFDGTKYFFAVDAAGVWWQIVTQEEWKDHGEELDDIPVLVCENGVKKGEPGKFREYGHDSAKKKPQKWKAKDGVWQRKTGLFD
eukprot:INCI19751.1.p1 GENE.INCI19751.1~~INCI19751.1.p1  ORF type:complete len:305 (+),score=54.50 INCI19751.1:435-1349(+)